VLRSEISNVVGLEHTYLLGSEPVPEPIVPGNTDLDGDGTEDSLEEIPYLAVDTYGWSAGAIATTPADLVAFVRSLFDGTLLDDSAIAQLTDRSHDGEHPLGLVQFEQAGWGHNGGAPGYHAVYVHQPDRGVTGALFTNCPECAAGTQDTWEVVADLLASVDA
jgi:D-alanyl-D-alanine carboxypeptidase